MYGLKYFADMFYRVYNKNMSSEQCSYVFNYWLLTFFIMTIKKKHLPDNAWFEELIAGILLVNTTKLCFLDNVLWLEVLIADIYVREYYKNKYSA